MKIIFKDLSITDFIAKAACFLSNFYLNFTIFWRNIGILSQKIVKFCPKTDLKIKPLQLCRGFFIVMLMTIISACDVTKLEMINLNPNIQSSEIKNQKIWDVFDQKINILIIDNRTNKFKIEGLEKYQKDKVIYIEDGEMLYLDEVIGYKKYSKDKITYLALNQNIMPVLRIELAKGLRDKGFKIVSDNYDRILTIILEDLSYITKKDGFFTESKAYLKLKVKSGLYEKLYEITIEDEEFWGISLEDDEEEINKLIQEAIISILNNKKLILMLQG